MAFLCKRAGVDVEFPQRFSETRWQLTIGEGHASLTLPISYPAS